MAANDDPTQYLTDEELIMPSAPAKLFTRPDDGHGMKGHAVVRRYIDGWLLCDIFVPTLLRRHGRGNDLLERVLTAAAGVNKDSHMKPTGIPVWLVTASNEMPLSMTNKELRAWYERCGFQVVEKDEWEDRLMVWHPC